MASAIVPFVESLHCSSRRELRVAAPAAEIPPSPSPLWLPRGLQRALALAWSPRRRRPLLVLLATLTRTLRISSHVAAPHTDPPLKITSSPILPIPYSDS